MSVVGGAFSAGRVFRGGAQSARPSSYYMGFWPCQQADGDADDEQVTDRSGKGAHATLGSLTSTEAWANAGYLTSLDDDEHSAQLPIAYWTHRMTTRSLLLSMQVYAEKGVSSLRFWGSGVGTVSTGPMLICTSTGAVQFALNITTTGTTQFFTGTAATPFSAASLHTIGIAYDHTTRTVSYFIDGAFSSSAANLSSEVIAAADGAYPSFLSLSGRPAGAAGRLANQMRFQHALNLPVLPANIAALMQRLHAHPRLMLRDSDVSN